jgi:hypothetical protein
MDLEMTKYFLYSADVMFVCDYMTIFHPTFLEVVEKLDLDKAEEQIIKSGKDMLLYYYGFDISQFLIDVIVEWIEFPNE